MNLSTFSHYSCFLTLTRGKEGKENLYDRAISRQLEDQREIKDALKYLTQCNLMNPNVGDGQMPVRIGYG